MLSPLSDLSLLFCSSGNYSIVLLVRVPKYQGTCLIWSGLYFQLVFLLSITSNFLHYVVTALAVSSCLLQCETISCRLSPLPSLKLRNSDGSFMRASSPFPSLLHPSFFELSLSMLFPCCLLVTLPLACPVLSHYLAPSPLLGYTWDDTKMCKSLPLSH